MTGVCGKNAPKNNCFFFFNFKRSRIYQLCVVYVDVDRVAVLFVDCVYQSMCCYLNIDHSTFISKSNWMCFFFICRFSTSTVDDQFGVVYWRRPDDNINVSNKILTQQCGWVWLDGWKSKYLRSYALFFLIVNSSNMAGNFPEDHISLYCRLRARA